MIVVIGGIKGGSGKTTLATNLAVMRSQHKRVLLVDADEQRSSSDWVEHRESQRIHTPWTTIQLAGPGVRTQLLKMIDDYDDIIVDTGGRDTTSQRSALTIANVFIAPFQPRSLDVWTAGKVSNLVSEIKSVNQDLITYALINRADSIGSDNSDTAEILKEFESIRFLPTSLGQRKVFANAAAEGLAVIEHKTKDPKAIQEITAFYTAIFDTNTTPK